jgi:hypothetical protein
MAESMHVLAPVPRRRPTTRKPRVSHPRLAPSTEKVLKSALGFGLLVNLAALLVPTLLPAGILAGWQDRRYGGDDFLLAAAVLLSGYGLLVAGRLSRRPHPPHGSRPRSSPGDRAPR